MGFVGTWTVVFCCSVEPWCLLLSSSVLRRVRHLAHAIWLPFREFFDGADRRLCHRNPRITPVSATVSPPRPIVRVCGLRVCGFCDLSTPNAEEAQSSYFRLTLSTPDADMFPLSSFRGHLSAATCDVGPRASLKWELVVQTVRDGDRRSARVGL